MSFDWSQLRVLVVEDDEEMRDILREIFDGRGSHVSVARDGQEAWQSMQMTPVDLVMTDVQMPVMGGIELLKKIRRKDPKMPIVLFATGNTQLSEKDMRELGAAGLLLKPFNLRTLADQVEKLFREAEESST